MFISDFFIKMIIVGIIFLIVFLARREEWLIKIITIVQLFIPFLLLRFLLSNHIYQGNEIKLLIPSNVKILIAFLVVVFLMENILILKKKKGGVMKNLYHMEQMLQS